MAAIETTRMAPFSQAMPLEIIQNRFFLRRSFYLRSSGHGEAHSGHYMQDFLDSYTAPSVLRRRAHLTLLQDAAVVLDSAKLNADLSQRRRRIKFDR